MSPSFKDKRALVTGAGKGIGREIAIALYENGAKTVAISRTQSDLDSLKQICPYIETVCLDLANWDTTRNTVEDLGVFDLLVNNAGISPRVEPFLECKVEDFDNIFNINVKATFNVSQVVARGMVENGKRGAIVNISSVASKIGLIDHTFYCASKGALDSMTQVMASELGKYGIRVNSVNPTVTLTPMGEKIWCSDKEKMNNALEKIPLRKFASTKEVMDPVLYLLSENASMINGAFLPIDGGFLSSK